MNDDNTPPPSPETIRAVAKVLRYASFLDDRVAAADKGRVEVWSKQVERHGLIEGDMMAGLQKYYDGPHDRAIGIGELIALSRGERRERNEREETVERERRENERDAKLEAQTQAIASGFVAGPIPASTRTERLAAAERALQGCHGKHESRVAIAEYMEARKDAVKTSTRKKAS